MLVVESFLEFTCPPIQVFRGRLDVTPMPASRPRVTENGTYTPKQYRQYKKTLTYLLKSLRIPKGNWHALDVTYWFPHTKHASQRYRLAEFRHRKKPDADNLLKGTMDALTQAKVLVDDGQLSDITCHKRYCLGSQGFSTFRLTAYI